MCSGPDKKLFFVFRNLLLVYYGTHHNCQVGLSITIFFFVGFITIYFVSQWLDVYFFSLSTLSCFDYLSPVLPVIVSQWIGQWIHIYGPAWPCYLNFLDFWLCHYGILVYLAQLSLNGVHWALVCQILLFWMNLIGFVISYGPCMFWFLPDPFKLTFLTFLNVSQVR